MHEIKPNAPAPCPHCNRGPIPDKTLDAAFIESQVQAIKEFLKNESIKGHSNGCILWRMVCSGLHPQLVIAYMTEMVQSVPKIIRPN